MPKKVKVLTDKYKSTTKIYPKVIMDSLTPEVRQYIESQGGGELEKTVGNITGKIYFDEWGDYGLAPVLELKKDDTHKSQVRVWGNKTNNEDIYGASISYQDGSVSLATVGIDKDGITISGINKDININTTGTSKLYINGVEYTGGKQLYQHNIILYYNSTNKIFANISITNDSNLTFNAYTLKDYLINNNIVDLPSYQNGGFVANGWVKATYNKSIINIYASTDYPNYLYFGCIRQDNGTLSNEGVVLNDSNLSIVDTIIPL